MKLGGSRFGGEKWGGLRRCFSERNAPSSSETQPLNITQCCVCAALV